MTKDDIIRKAREAGFEMDDSCVLEPSIVWYIVEGQLERFAALVAAAEREACAKVVQDNAMACEPGSMLQVYLASNATAIRARGQA